MLWRILSEASLTALRQTYSLAQILLHWTIVGLCVIEFNSAEAIRDQLFWRMWPWRWWLLNHAGPILATVSIRAPADRHPGGINMFDERYPGWRRASSR